MCMELSVDLNADIIFVDYALNDGMVGRINNNGKVVYIMNAE